MKRIMSLLTALCCCALLCVRGLAVTFVDDMTMMANDDFRRYTDLRHVDKNILAGMIDQTAFTLVSILSPAGWVDYRVQGAQQITVGFYSHMGTFVTQQDNGDWMMGLYEDNTAALNGKTLLYSLYSPSSQSIWARIGGELHKAYTDPYGGSYTFVKSTESPADLKNYAINVYVSPNGSSYTQIEFTSRRLHFTAGTSAVYEEWTATLPSATAYIRVELNDVGQVPILNRPGESIEKSPYRYNCLASVTLTGDELIFGSPDPVVDETPSSSASESESESPVSESASSGSASSSRASGNSGSSKAPSSKASSAPTIKFKGEAVPSAGSVQTAREPARSAAPPSAASPASTVREETQAPADTHQPEQDVVYRIENTGNPVREQEAVSSALKAYIVAVSGAALTVAVRSGTRR